MANVSSSNGIEKFPELRFPNFSGPWKCVRIGDIYAERSERGAEGAELLSVTMTEGVKRRSDIEGKDNSSEDKGNYKVVCAGDMVYNSMRMWQGANGISPYNGIVSPAYTVLTPREKISNGFFAALFKTHVMISEFYRHSQGMTSDTWNLKYPQIETIKTYIPPYDEQNKISNFLELLNHKIDYQRRIVELLKKYKRGVLQNSFAPKEGKWYKQRFGDFFTEQNERTSETDRYPICSLTVEEGIILKPERYFREFLITKEGDSYKILRNGWFAYNPMNAHIGAIAPNRTGLDVCVSGYYNIFSVKNTSTTAFWEEFLKCYNMLCYYKVIATGSLIEKQRVHYSQFVDIELPLPSIEEQTRTASLIEVLNKKIRNAEFVLNHLQSLKTGIMQKMFI